MGMAIIVFVIVVCSFLVLIGFSGLDVVGIYKMPIATSIAHYL